MQILVSWFSGNTWETFVSTTKYHSDGSLATRMGKLAATSAWPEAKPLMIEFAKGFAERIVRAKHRSTHHGYATIDDRPREDKKARSKSRSEKASI